MWEKVQNLFRSILRKWKIIITVIILLIICWMVVLKIMGYVWAKFTGFDGKSLWDFADLLLVPFSLAFFAIVIERRNRKADRENALDQQIEVEFKNYIDEISTLIFENGLKAIGASEDVRVAAQVKTDIIIPKLDNRRSIIVYQFLMKTGLICSGQWQDLPLIAVLGVNLAGINCYRANLKGAILTKANFENAFLMDCDFSGALLIGAKFDNATIINSNFEHTFLYETSFQNVIQRDVSFTQANYNKNTLWPKDFDPKKAGAIMD